MSSQPPPASPPPPQPPAAAPPRPPLRARVLVRNCDPALLRAVVADIAQPPAPPEVLALLPGRMPGYEQGSSRPSRLDSLEDGVAPLPFSVPLQATYYCGMVQRNVWENVPLTVVAYDGGSTLSFFTPIQRGWQLDDHPHSYFEPVEWPGDSEWTRPSQEQFFLRLSMTLSPADVTLVCGNDEDVSVLSSWDEAFMGASSEDAAAALQWSEHREVECMIQFEGAPWAYLTKQHFYASDYTNAARLTRAATQPFGEVAGDSLLPGDEDASETYNYYHEYYDQYELIDDEQHERPWRVQARYDTWQHLCWLNRWFMYDTHRFDKAETMNDDLVADRALCRGLLRGGVRHDAAEKLPEWEYDSTLAAEARNATLLQLHVLGLPAGRAAPLEYFRFIDAVQPLMDVATRRVQLHHAARVIQRCWHRATGCPEYAMARARVTAMMTAEDTDD